MLVIFIGSYAPVVAIATHILPPLIAVSAAVAIALAGTWLLRPKMTQRA